METKGVQINPVNPELEEHIFRGFTLTAAEQARIIASWPNPVPYVVVEPALYRKDEFGKFTFLIAKRRKGALSEDTAKQGIQPAKISLHPGGRYIMPNSDNDPCGAVVRSLRVKLGYSILRNAARFVGTAGPALNFSSLRIKDGKVWVVIHEVPAEPKVPFVALIHVVDMSQAEKVGEGNGSLENLGFFTAENIAEQFSDECIYPTFLKVAHDVLSGRRPPGQSAIWLPGEYLFDDTCL